MYKRYASLYFCMAIDVGDNELITLEVIHRYVELYGNFDIIFDHSHAYLSCMPPHTRRAVCSTS